MEQMEKFVARMVGRPYAGPGFCWTLIVMAFREIYGIELLDFKELENLNGPETNEFFEKLRPSLQEVEMGREQPGDVIIMRQGRYVSHAGLVVQPGLMLHAEAGREVAVERFRDNFLRTRLVGIYRHEQLARHH
jgi:cell wall-associated NlpC family hydrolase